MNNMSTISLSNRYKHTIQCVVIVTYVLNFIHWCWTHFSDHNTLDLAEVSGLNNNKQVCFWIAVRVTWKIVRGLSFLSINEIVYSRSHTSVLSHWMASWLLSRSHSEWKWFGSEWEATKHAVQNRIIQNSLNSGRGRGVHWSLKSSNEKWLCLTIAISIIIKKRWSK